MKIIGLCGGSGSGKGYCSHLFLKYNIPAIDTDKIYHELVSRPSECLDELVSEFGNVILTDDGVLNRKVLADIVFTKGIEKQQRLNGITHKYVLNEVRSQINTLAGHGYPAVLIDAPLLFESGFNKECNAVIAVIADYDVRIKRIITRDKISIDKAIRRVRSQIPDDLLRKYADYIIVNNGNEDELMKQVDLIAETIINN